MSKFKLLADSSESKAAVADRNKCFTFDPSLQFPAVLKTFVCVSLFFQLRTRLFVHVVGRLAAGGDTTPMVKATMTRTTTLWTMAMIVFGWRACADALEEDCGKCIDVQ